MSEKEPHRSRHRDAPTATHHHHNGGTKIGADSGKKKSGVGAGRKRQQKNQKKKSSKTRGGPGTRADARQTQQKQVDAEVTPAQDEERWGGGV